MSRFKTYRCGGYAALYGHCGAGDCERCHPGGARRMAVEEAGYESTKDLHNKLAGLRLKLIEVETELAPLKAKVDATDAEAERHDALQDQHYAIECEIEAAEEEIDGIERRIEADFDDGPDEPPDRHEEDYGQYEPWA